MKKLYLIIILILQISLKGWGQQIKPLINSTLNGQVMDENTHKPIAGAYVLIKGTTHGVQTDTNGHFFFQTGQKFPFTLIISFVGYKKIDFIATATPIIIYLKESAEELSEIVITSRRRKEAEQDLPIPITAIAGAKVAETGAFNVNRLKELIPSVQLYSSNPRNTALNIRGLGTSFGLTNDGIDPGVGFYVDGVYYARPAATSMDFIDIEQVEVLRGPQGTLYGKNSTAGNFNITTKQASFTQNANFELSYGNYGFIQTKASVTGPIHPKVAARISFTGTQRDGLLYHVGTGQHINDMNNIGARGQLLYTPNDRVKITLIGDLTKQRPLGYAQVFAGVVPTLRAAYRQFDQIAKDLSYTVPSANPYNRLIDSDTPWKANQDLGGVVIRADISVGAGTLTAISAWRYWNWDPSNDRDFTGLQALKLSQAPSKHNQYSQEIRWSGTLSPKVSATFGVFIFGQELRSDPDQKEESGSATWRFSQSTTSPLWKTPGLFDGYGIKTKQLFKSLSTALFTQFDFAIGRKLSILPGLRYNLDRKQINFNRTSYGGLQTNDPALLALKALIYTNQVFDADIENVNLSGQLTFAYKINPSFNTFATFSTGYKPMGLNLGGLPNADGKPMLELAIIKPESVNHTEIGLKSKPDQGATLNLTLFHTAIQNYQTLVQTADLSVNRGYLANAESVRVRGIELDGTWSLTKHFSFYGNIVYTEGIYVTFKNAPVPLEETGGANFKDISGSDLPGISKIAASFGGDYTRTAKLLRQKGEFFIALDGYYRSDFSSSPSPSKYLNIRGYTLFNARVGFRVSLGLSVALWSRNLLDQNYMELLLPGAGNTGQYAAVLGDPQTFGITMRHSF